MLDIKVDTREFDKAFKEYLTYNARAIPELVNTTAYMVARNAVGSTYAPPKEKIRESLVKPARINPKSPIASILVNIKRKKEGKPGLNGQKMVTATESFIKRRESFRQFARSGWLAAVKKLASYVPKKSGQAPLPKGVRMRGTATGGAAAARANTNWKAVASIWNSIAGKHNTSKVKQYLEEGLQKAVNQEAKSKLEYVARKKLEGAVHIL